MLLHDIKENIMFSSIYKDKAEDREEAKRSTIDNSRIPATSSETGFQVNRESLGLFYPSVQSTANAGFLGSSTGGQLEFDENMIKQLTMQVLNDKMPNLLNEIQKDKSEALFKPVETKPAQSREEEEARNKTG